jgi:hypothetical protein
MSVPASCPCNGNNDGLILFKGDLKIIVYLQFMFIYGKSLAVTMAMAIGLLVFKKRDKIEA